MAINIALFILVLLLLLCIVGYGLCWYIANRLLHRPHRAPAYTIPVIASDDTTITLKHTPETDRPGTFGISGESGQAIVGAILTKPMEVGETITRELIQVAGKLPSQVRWTTTVYSGRLKDSLGLPIRDITISGPLGAMPAWSVAGKTNDWAILVHGATASRDQGLRAFTTLANAGLNILAITFRNDGEAPASSDGHSHLGDSEWQDLEAAVAYALEQKAEHIILYGWSLGGTIIRAFLSRSKHAEHIQAAILDAPILNWRATLTKIIKKNRLSFPRLKVLVTGTIIAQRTGVRITVLDSQDHFPERLPLLLYHGTSDNIAPVTVSDIFAEEHRNVSYHRFYNAEHTQCWNEDSERYETILRRFLTQVLQPHERAAQAK